MTVERVELPNGEQYEIDTANPEHMAWLTQAAKTAQPKAGGIMDGYVKPAAKSVARGALTGLASFANSRVSSLDPKTGEQGKSLVGEAVQGYADKNFPSQEGLHHRFLEGAGGGLSGGGPRDILARLLAGGAGTATADATTRMVEPISPQLAKVAGPLAGVLVGGGVGAAAGSPKARSLEQGAADDTNTLTNMALNRVGPQANTEQVANRAGAASTKLLGDRRQDIRNELTQTMQGMPDIPLADALRIQQGLGAKAASTSLEPDAAAISELARALTSNTARMPGGPRQMNGLAGWKQSDIPAPLTKPQDLALAVKAFKDNPPTTAASSGKNISDHQRRNAIGLAEDEFRTAIPGYGPAMDRYGSRMRAEVDSLEAGPLGKLAGKRQFDPDPVNPGALGQIVSKQSPQAIGETLDLLNRTDSGVAQQIARALLQEKVTKAPLAPGRVLRGTEGSLEDQRFGALVKGGGADPNRVAAPLSAADKIPEMLKGGDARSGAREYLGVGASGLTLRGILTPDIFRRMAGKREYYEAIRGLMKTASPEELQQLNRLAIFDPSIKALIAAQGAGTTLLQQEGN